MLRRQFSIAAVLVLAIGIGANTAIFSVVNEVLLRPLPYRDGDRLVMLWSRDARVAGDGWMPATPAEYADFRAGTRSFAGMAASGDGVFNLTGAGEPEMLIGYKMEPAMFGVLGVAPALGRAFVAGDGERVVVLSDRLWRDRFGGDRAVVGRAVQLNQESYTVVGVMPPTFDFPKSSALWAPLVIAPEIAQSRDQRYLRIVARLAPGVSPAAAGADLAAVAARAAAEHPDSNRNVGSQVVTLRDMETRDIRTPLFVLSGAVGFLLLLACANVAALLVARTAGRRRELAIRVALGATRGRLVRQLLGETLVVTVAGGVLAVLLSSWSTDALLALFPRKLGNVAMPDVKDIPVDAVVLGFSFLISALCAFLCGLPPAFAATGGDVERALREGAAGEPPRATRLRRWLVGGELALATVIAVGAALLMKSSINLARTSLGFETEGVVSARLFLSDKRYPDAARQRRLVADVLARLRAQPGVASAGAVTTLPLSGWWSQTMFARADHPGEELEAAFLVSEPGYFETLRIPLRGGRLFGPGDVEGAPEVAVVDELLAARYFPGGDALGKRVNCGTAAEPLWRTIIGVVGTVRENGPAREARPTMYVPFAQKGWPLVALVVKARDGRAAALAGAVRAATWQVDPDQPLSYVLTLDEMRADVMATTRVITFLFSFFAGMALLLGALGVYGVTSSVVGRRTREIAVRMALGARRGDVAAWVLRQTAAVAAAGLVLGLGLSLALTRVLGSLLHGVTATDPWVIAAVCAVLLGAALAAAALPARRATRIDPAVALRSE